MKRHIKSGLKYIFSSLIRRSKAERLIVLLAKGSDVNLLNLAYRSMGILKYEDFAISGEEFVMRTVIPDIIDTAGGRKPVMFDVGANIGDFSCHLAKFYPSARIYSFEPNKFTFEKLTANSKQFNNIIRSNAGLGSEKSTLTIYTYDNELASGHASVFKEVFTDLHGAGKLLEQQVPIERLTDFCQEHGVDKIDFLKVDTEGFELEVLKGALEMIEEGKINAIQFEFNEMNIVSRVFLKDFYDLLKGYDFFRVDTDKLIPLCGYNSTNEIFQIQNILAIRKR